MTETGQPQAKRPAFDPKVAHKGGKKGAKKPSGILKDARWVYSHGPEADKTPGRQTLRKMLNDNPKEFLAMLSRLEAAYRTGGTKQKEISPVAGSTEGVSGTKPAGEPDQGEERVGELIGRLLEEWKEQNS